MRSSLGLDALAGLSFSAVGVAYADPALTVMPTHMRVAPDSRSAIVQAIPANAEIDVSDCSNVWCGASWRGLAGYVRMSALSFDDNAQPPAQPIYGYPPPDQPAYGYPPPEPGPAVVLPIPFGLGGSGDRRHDGERGGGGGDHGHDYRGAPPPHAQTPPPAQTPGRNASAPRNSSGANPWDPNATGAPGHR